MNLSGYMMTGKLKGAGGPPAWAISDLAVRYKVKQRTLSSMIGADPSTKSMTNLTVRRTKYYRLDLMDAWWAKRQELV